MERNIELNLKEDRAGEQLRQIHENSVFGHASDNIDPFEWQPSAAVFDELTLGEVNYSIKDLHKIFPSEEWRFSMQTATPRPLPEILKGDRLAKTQALLIDAIDLLPKLVQNKNDSQGRLIRGLLEYGLGNDGPSNLLRQIIYDYRNPHQRLVKSWRFDMVGEEKISEVQVAAAGWVPQDRIAQSSPQFLGSGHGPAKAFIEMVRVSSGKNHPKAAIYVDKGVSSYWPEWNDFRLSLREVDPKTHVFVVGNEGFEYDRRERKLFYVNSSSGRREALDVVYTFADARRLLSEDSIPLLEAVADRAVKIEPTLNPLLNNYHLIRAFLFHKSVGFGNLLFDAFGLSGISNPQSVIEEAKKQTIPMSLVDNANTLDLSSIGEGEYPWEDVINNLAQNNGDSQVKKILSNGNRDKLIMRVLLSKDLSRISGGRGSRKLSDFKTYELLAIFRESAEGVKELRTQGYTDKTIVGVEPLIKHQPRAVNIFSLDTNGNVNIQQLSEAVQRCCPSFIRTHSGQIPRMCGILSFYSGKDGGYKLGRSIYAIGAHY